MFKCFKVCSNSEFFVNLTLLFKEYVRSTKASNHIFDTIQHVHKNATKRKKLRKTETNYYLSSDFWSAINCDLFC